MNKLLLVMLAACRLPHVEPVARDATVQRATLAAINSSCTSADPFDSFHGYPDSGPPAGFPIEWAPAHSATGVVISERHVLTVAHAVRCPVLTSADATMSNGTHHVAVERDDDMFPHGEASTDMARLELFHAGRFGLNVPPPYIRTAISGETCCAETLRGRMCGVVQGNLIKGLGIRPGDSGSPVYCDGALVGLITRDNGAFVAVTSYWLEGT